MGEFKRVKFKINTEFKDFCKNKFGNDIGIQIYNFILELHKKPQMDMFTDVTPESKRRITFVSYLYETYGLNNIMLGIECFYKQVSLNICNLNGYGYKYFKAIVSSPKMEAIKNWNESCSPYSMSPHTLREFKEDLLGKFLVVHENYKNNREEIDSKIMENWYGAEINNNLKEEVSTEVKRVIPIQVKHSGTGSLNNYENYIYQCPVCDHTGKEYKPYCLKCGAVFDFSIY